MSVTIWHLCVDSDGIIVPSAVSVDSDFWTHLCWSSRKNLLFYHCLVSRGEPPLKHCKFELWTYKGFVSSEDNLFILYMKFPEINLGWYTSCWLIQASLCLFLPVVVIVMLC